MEIVKAFWEKRNMGVDCVEITLTAGDEPDSCREEILAAEAEYTVVKVPTACPDLSFMVQDLGYKYIECIFSLRRSTQMPQLTPQQSKMIEMVTYSKMEEADYERLFEEIRNDMFDTGRVFLDDHFTHSQSAERYIGWINDEIGRGTDFYKLKYKEDDCGFFGFKQVREGVFLPFLAGMYPGGPRVFGLGFSLCYMEIKEANRRGARTITGSVSSNNIASLAALTSFGYIIDGAHSVYVKHASDPEPNIEKEK